MAKRNTRADHDGPHRRVFEKNKQKILKTETICALCGKPVDFSQKYPEPLAPVIDHIIPVSLGGHPSALENMQLAHCICNRQKGAKLQRDARPPEPEEVITNRDLPLSMDWTKYRSEK